VLALELARTGSASGGYILPTGTKAKDDHGQAASSAGAAGLADQVFSNGVTGLALLGQDYYDVPTLERPPIADSRAANWSGSSHTLLVSPAQMWRWESASA